MSSYVNDAQIQIEYPFEYTTCGNGAVLLGFTFGGAYKPPEDRTFPIPSTLGGLPIVAINEGAFSGHWKHLPDVIDLPNTIVLIGVGAFANTDITAIRIPSSVARIEEEAFALTPYLRSIEVDPSNPFYSSSPDGWLTEHLGFDLIRYVPKEEYSSVNIPKEIHFIENRAFSGSDISSVTMGEVKSIGEGAFLRCNNLSSVKFSDNLRLIKDRAFSGCQNLTQIEIPKSVHSMGKDVFQYCSPDLVLTVTEGSYAQRWAEENGIAYEIL